MKKARFIFLLCSFASFYLSSQTIVETVSSGTSGDATLKIEADTDNNNENDNPKIHFSQDGGLTSGYMGLIGDAGSLFTNSNVNSLFVQSPGSFDFQIATNNMARVTVNNSGNMGIGTTTPSEKLEVAGHILASGVTTNIRIEGTGSGNYNGANLILSAKGVNAGNKHASTYFITHRGLDGVATLEMQRRDIANTYNGTLLLYKDGHGWEFRTASAVGSSGTSTMFSIKNSGNVGIGTTSPDAKLAVKGNIHTNEVKVDLLGAIAPDYVFYEDYDLKSLKAVEDYIASEGHLPNIPSAKEMEADGIKLKEMNLKLLEKIEELTLYTINQEKRIKVVEEENVVLKEQTQRMDLLEEKINVLLNTKD